MSCEVSAPRRRVPSGRTPAVKLMDAAPRSLTREDLLAAVEFYGARASLRTLQLHLRHKRAVLRAKLEALENEGLLRREETWALVRVAAEPGERVAVESKPGPGLHVAPRCSASVPSRRQPLIRARMRMIHQRLRAAGDEAWVRVDELVAELRLPRDVIRHTLLYLHQEGLAEPGERETTGHVGASSRLWRARP